MSWVNSEGLHEMPHNVVYLLILYCLLRSLEIDFNLENSKLCPFQICDLQSIPVETICFKNSVHVYFRAITMVQGRPTVSGGMQDNFLLPPLVMLRQKDRDSETTQTNVSPDVVPIVSTGTLSDALLSSLFNVLMQKTRDPVTTTDVPPTHNECTCDTNSDEDINSASEMDLISLFYSEFSEETTYYEEDLTDTRPAVRGRRHRKRHGKKGRRHRLARRSRDQREESPAVIYPLPDIIMDTLFKQ